MRLCIVCQQPIEEDRIDAIPETRLCVQHGREISKYGGEFTLGASQERTSKQGSLKLNYGGITTSRVRNDAGLNQLLDDFERQQFREAEEEVND